MRLIYDPSKNDRNIRERGLSFEEVLEFDLPNAVIKIDSRKDYGETRYVATGYLGLRLHVLCYAETLSGLRVISFRKANDRERKKHEKEIETTDW